METKLAMFEGKKIRRHWDGKLEKWYFSDEWVNGDGPEKDYRSNLKMRHFDLSPSTRVILNSESIY